MSIIEEAPGYLQVLSDGSVLRFQQQVIAASTESESGCISKDVTVEAPKNVTARIFLPVVSAMLSNRLLPVLVYFHGGGFCIGSTAWLGYHQFLGDLCVKSRCIVLSVDYSAGANISHHVALKALRSPISLVTIRGVLLIHPYFGSERRTQKESANETSMEVLMNDMFWRLSIPEGLNRDYYGCNYETMIVSDEEWERFPEVVVHVAGLDFLKERGVLYSEFMKKRGVKWVNLIEAAGEQHVYHVFYPESAATRLLQQQMSDFINKF
ncbi:hypothetical protein MLD38_014088 [Melastoma candidum]|uniref:Uncharacterized protein n=1 Tax=Melastoma candidum TaxID=119954 RepID=A0ACB9RFU6_9MYRT|nr:hypothetical protein MLD38_014088 [Melastoma candidum]